MDIKLTKQPDGYWVAIDADEYEAECDAIGCWSDSPVGYGKTAREAINELLDEIEDRLQAAIDELLAEIEERASAA